MMPVDRCLAEIAALPLKDGVRHKWLQDNAARFLDLDR
jgi:predicted TIM-barrel fold metal-dependent hydrolase